MPCTGTRQVQPTRGALLDELRTPPPAFAERPRQSALAEVTCATRSQLAYCQASMNYPQEVA